MIALIVVFWFEVPVHGNLALLFLGTALYLMTTLAIGLFLSTVSQTQQQAMMGTFFFYFPAVPLSGFMFPIANMPQFVPWLTCLNPLRYFLVVIRGVFLKGVGLSILWPQMAALLVMGTLALWLASRRFRKTLACSREEWSMATLQQSRRPSLRAGYVNRRPRRESASLH